MIWKMLAAGAGLASLMAQSSVATAQKRLDEFETAKEA